MAHVPLFIGPLIWYVCLYWVKSKLSVCFEWAEERNDLIQIIGDSETIPPVDPEILNIIGKGEVNYWLRKFYRPGSQEKKRYFEKSVLIFVYSFVRNEVNIDREEEFYFVRNSLIVMRTLMRIKSQSP